MKKFIVMLFICFIAIPSWLFAADLVCDPQQGVTSYIVEVDGVETYTDAQPDGSLKLNIDYLTAGQHTFKARAVSAEGWPSDWSDPLQALKPTMGDLRLVF